MEVTRFLTDLFLTGLIFYAFLIVHIWYLVEGPWWIVAIVVLQIGSVTHIIAHRTAYAVQLIVAVSLHCVMEYWVLQMDPRSVWLVHTGVFVVVFVTFSSGVFVYCMELAPSNTKALKECKGYIERIQTLGCTGAELVENMDEFRSCYDDLCMRDRTTILESLVLDRVKGVV